ncbi:MAG: YbaN family protein, partial [Candidatus Aminicenantes bacterium]|nr:YbaN family protein [Candidatus Aminicenantes bacterium]
MRKNLLILAGGLCTVLGVVGMFLPLLPTTPFLLLAAACYAKSSPQRLQRLLSNRWFGRYLRDYRDGLGIPMRIKTWTLSLLWTAIALSATFATSLLWVRILLGTIALGVTLHILMLP